MFDDFSQFCCIFGVLHFEKFSNTTKIWRKSSNHCNTQAPRNRWGRGARVPLNFRGLLNNFLRKVAFSKGENSVPHLKKVIPPSLCIENNYSRYLLFYKKSEEKKRILSNRRTSFAWIPPAPPRVKNLSCIVLMYHRLDLSSNSN